MSAEKMHVWTLDDGEEYAVAADFEDAIEVFAESHGLTVGDFLAEYGADVSKVLDDEEFSCTFDDASDAPEWCKVGASVTGSRKVTATAREWADGEGRGYLFGSNW